MQEFDVKGLFDSFYDKLVLRDLGGKVVPGALMLASLMFLAFGLDAVDRFLDRMTLVLWVIFGGVSWSIGFVLQYIGEVLRILRNCPHGSTNPKMDRLKFYDIWATFQSSASPYERVQAERLNIIKEACGNTCISVSFSTLLIFGSLYSKNGGLSNLYWVIAGVLMVFSTSLWRMHVIHVERYGELAINTVNRIREEKETVEQHSDAQVDS